MKTVEIDGVSFTENQIIEAYKKLQKTELYERCREGYVVNGHGFVFKEGKADYYDNFNLYPTKELAEKAAKLMKENNKLILACLLVDPNYEPSWGDTREWKYSVVFATNKQRYELTMDGMSKRSVAYVGTGEKAEEVVKLMTEWKDL